jgi:hypothetical protein
VLHGHHVKNRAATLWFRNLPTVRSAGLPEQHRAEHHQQHRHPHKHHEIGGQDDREALAEAVAAKAAAKAAATAATAIDVTAGAPPKLGLARQESECSSTSGDMAEPSPGVGSGRLHAVITEQFTRPAPTASELPAPVGEVERDKQQAEAREAAFKTHNASMIETTLAMPAGVPEPHAATEKEAREKAALLLGPWEAKIKEEMSGSLNPLTGGSVVFNGAGVSGGPPAAAAAALKPLPRLLRGSMKGEQGQEAEKGAAEEGATMGTTAGHV